MAILVDTNVLLRRIQANHPSHATAVGSVARLVTSGEGVHFTLQNIAEFWNVATRPTERNGLGLSVTDALAEIQEIERFLILLPDVPAIYQEWRRLVEQHRVLGVKVHDARLVAAMKVHGIRRLLTFDASDFSRYGLDVIHPSSVQI